ncbi:protein MICRORCHIDIA 7-like [Magnolia sinica]|uniref:protein MICRORCHIDIA 7-like n=1 Tax=Magnolia sinica TaxID=86752 RepID=UPI0026586F4B|nr:protein MICRORCHIDIA 7-like [Magnolia sinica]
MDHDGVHPKILHSNATSHKWALGAFAELLDNSLDEVCHGATYVNIDVLEIKKDKSRILLIDEPEHYRGPKLKVAIIGARLAGWHVYCSGAFGSRP